MSISDQIVSYDIPDFSISADLVDCENQYEQLHYIYEDALDNYNDVNNHSTAALEYINYLEEQIIICEHNLYDLRLKEFIIIEKCILNLILIRNNIVSKIQVYNTHSTNLLKYVKDIGYKKEELIIALYYQNINDEHIKKLNDTLLYVLHNIKKYKDYLDNLCRNLEHFENNHM